MKLGLKTKYALSLMLVMSVMLIPMFAGAQFDPNRGAGDTHLSTKSVYDVLITIMKYGLAILTILGVIGFIVSGIIYITAGGAGKADMASKWLTNSIIGILVGLIGYIVIRLISNILSGNTDV